MPRRHEEHVHRVEKHLNQFSQICIQGLWFMDHCKGTLPPPACTGLGRLILSRVSRMTFLRLFLHMVFVSLFAKCLCSRPPKMLWKITHNSWEIVSDDIFQKSASEFTDVYNFCDDFLNADGTSLTRIVIDTHGYLNIGKLWDVLCVVASLTWTSFRACRQSRLRNQLTSKLCT